MGAQLVFNGIPMEFDRFRLDGFPRHAAIGVVLGRLRLRCRHRFLRFRFRIDFPRDGQTDFFQKSRFAGGGGCRRFVRFGRCRRRSVEQGF